MYTTIGAYDTLSHLNYSQGRRFSFHDRGGGDDEMRGTSGVMNRNFIFLILFWGEGGGGEGAEENICITTILNVNYMHAPRNVFQSWGGGAKVLMIR